MYGLAGFRVGYALSHSDVAGLLNRVRQPFNVSQPALVAACAALEDEDFVRRSYELATSGREYLSDALRGFGLEVIPSFGNFVTFKCPRAALVNDKLLDNGIIVRPVFGTEPDRYLRVSVGTGPQNERFVSVLADVLGDVDSVSKH